MPPASAAVLHANSFDHNSKSWQHLILWRTASVRAVFFFPEKFDIPFNKVSSL